MLEVNKELLSTTKKYVSGGNKAKAISYLCENGCNIQLANKIVNDYNDPETQINEFMLQKLKSLLPSSNLKAIRVISRCYGVRLSFAQKLIKEIMGAKKITDEAIQNALSKLKANKKSNSAERPTGAVNGFNEHMNQLYVSGREQKMENELMVKYHFDPATANALIQEVGSQMRHRD